MNKHWIRRNKIYRIYMWLKAWLAWRSFGKLGSQITFFGITGTDGKSTTCGCLYTLLRTAGHQVGIISTVFLDIGEGLQLNETHMTSLDHKVFRDLIAQAEKNGMTHMVIEVSSHALHQYRVRPLMFYGVGITNISPEHLDFHRTMEHYARSKGELFGRLLDGGVAVLPYNFSYQSSLQLTTGDVKKTFGYDERADIFVDGLIQSPQLSFDLHIDDTIHIDSKLVGIFNCDNMMIASGLAHHAGLTVEQIKQGLESYAGLPGRQEIITTQQGISAMIDFALTPDALSTLYTATREMGYNRLIAVFGATGNRDQSKRPKMAAVATELCDVVIITEDENYHEDGREIMKQLASGITFVDQSTSDAKNPPTSDFVEAHLPGQGGTSDSGSQVVLIQDRTSAIRRGLEFARSGDIVIVTGMANYTSRAMNQGNIPWNEREVIEMQMRELGLGVIK